MTKIIGFTGLKTSGKTTAARYLQSRVGGKVLSFAESLRVEVTNLLYNNNLLSNMPVNIFKFTDYQNPTCDEIKSLLTHPEHKNRFRLLLQWYGSEFRRNLFGSEYWTKILQSQLFSAQYIFIDDVRFINELALLKEYDATIIHIHRPGIISDGHISEEDLSEYADYIIENDGTLNEFFRKIDVTI